MIRCEQVVQAAGDFLERRLALRKRLMVLLHVAMCRGCRAYLEQFELTLLGLRSLPRRAVVPASEALIEQFRLQSRRAGG